MLLQFILKGLRDNLSKDVAKQLKQKGMERKIDDIADKVGVGGVGCE